ncbi:HdeD family acid-resistance protein [Flavobacterium sp. JP2137]|uniref:HdeD family acid-resistance protein n=1 Tax=Flavobacterium sp. JP2137 TaxID=3414510 RepID=UPI003D300D93
MENRVIKTMNSAVKHWYLSVIVGILFILLGFWILRTPLEAYITLALLFSISFFVNGIFEIIFSISNRKGLQSWGWFLTMGIIDLLFGLWLMRSPELSLTVLPLFVGFMILFRSVSTIGFSIEIQAYGSKKWGWLLALGILGIVFSLILIWNPVIAGITIVFWTAMAFLTYGIARIVMGIRFKGLKSEIDKLSL